MQISLIKFWSAKVPHDLTERAIQMHGALGVSGDTPLESMFREARSARIYRGPQEVHRKVVARPILRTFRDGSRWEFEQQAQEASDFVRLGW